MTKLNSPINKIIKYLIKQKKNNKHSPKPLRKCERARLYISHRCGPAVRRDGRVTSRAPSPPPARSAPPPPALASRTLLIFVKHELRPYLFYCLLMRSRSQIKNNWLISGYCTWEFKKKGDLCKCIDKQLSNVQWSNLNNYYYIGIVVMFNTYLHS